MNRLIIIYQNFLTCDNFFELQEVDKHEMIKFSITFSRLPLIILNYIDFPETFSQEG